MTVENQAMASEVAGERSNPKKSRVKWLLLGGCGGVTLAVLACVVLWIVLIRGVGGEPANAGTAETLTRALVQALHDGDVESAHAMFVDEFRAQQTLEDLASVFLDVEYIRDYFGLDVCEFGVFGTREGRMLVGKGLLHYRGGDVVFESVLLKNADREWQIYGFHIQPELTPTPWGACKYD